MAKIPVTFEYNSKMQSGVLSEVNGAAGKTWYLYVDRFYLGQLLLTESGFMFYFQKEGYSKELSEYFEGVIIQWYG